MENHIIEDETPSIVAGLPDLLHDLICDLLDRPTSNDSSTRRIPIRFREPPKIVVFGGPICSKSIVNNLMLETLLHRIQKKKKNDGEHDEKEDDDPFILHIELCFAQPDLSPPGLVSVSKINCGGGHQTLLSKFIGTMDPHDCHDLYVRSLVELRDFIRKNPKLNKVPWILHTMQVFKGLGVKLGRDVLKIFQPTIIIRTNQEIVDELRVRQSESQIVITLNKKEAIFSKTLAKKKFRDNEPPTDSSSKSLSLTTCGLGSMTYRIRFDQILGSLIPGSLVALCHFAPKSFKLLSNSNKSAPAEEDTSQNWRRQIDPSHPSATMAPPSSSSAVPQVVKKWIEFGDQFSNNFIGYGLIHLVNGDKHQLELFTPLHQKILDTKVNCVVTTENIKLSPAFNDFAKFFGDDSKVVSYKSLLNRFSKTVDESLPLPLKNFIANDGYPSSSVHLDDRQLLIQRTRDKLCQNKLTPENIPLVLSKILEFDLLTKTDQMSAVTQTIIQKMVDEPTLSFFVPAQVALFVCCEMSNDQFEPELVENFMKSFVTECQREFEKPFLLPSSSLQPEEEGRRRDRGIGIVKLIGELFKSNLLTVGTMAKVLNQLLDHGTELGYECISTFFSTAGQQFCLKLKEVEEKNISGLKFGATQVQDFVKNFKTRMTHLLNNQEETKLSLTSRDSIGSVLTQFEENYDTFQIDLNPILLEEEVVLVTDKMENVQITTSQPESPDTKEISLAQPEPEDLQGQEEVVYRRFRPNFKK